MGSDSFKDLTQFIITGDGGAAEALVAKLIAEGVTGREILDSGLLPGMDTVGERMKAGECFIPEVLHSARAMQACLELVEPHMLAGETTKRGTIVIGTVEGDVHDIGKNLVGMMLESAGFKVVNLGIGVTPAQFVAAVTEHGGTVVGLSALLTTTMPAQKRTIEALKAAGLRDDVKVMIGGAPVTEAWAEEIGADAYGANAAAAVDRAKQLTGIGSVA